jgi:hypothetical protein
MKSITRVVPVAIMATAMTDAAHATVYNLIDEAIGPARATGTITTDGALGVLSISDITGVDITVAEGSNALAVDDTTTIIGSALTATAKGLFFDFAGDSISAFVTYSSVGENSGYCIATGSVACHLVYNDESIEVDSTVYDGRSLAGSTVEIATAVVPESATWVMMLVGVGAVGAVLRRRQQERAVAA